MCVLVRLPASFLRLFIKLILFSFSKSKADGIFSECVLSPAGLGFGRELAEADEERTAAVYAAALKVEIIALLLEDESRIDFCVKEEDGCF